MSNQNILLDPEIRDWVLYPLIYIMVVVGLLRHYVTLMSRASPDASDIPANRKEMNVLARCRLYMANGKHIRSDGFKSRCQGMLHSGSGELRKKVEANQMAMMDPSMMGDMMKKNMVMIVPQIAMMSLVSYFFSGFVIGKFPFPLTSRFRGMVQRGVEIDNLEVSYVTSLSMYFLVLFGIQGVLKLILGTNEGDETAMMPMQMQQQQQPAVDVPKLYKQTAEELEFAQDQYKYEYENVLDLLLQGK